MQGREDGGTPPQSLRVSFRLDMNIYKDCLVLSMGTLMYCPRKPFQKWYVDFNFFMAYVLLIIMFSGLELGYLIMNYCSRNSMEGINEQFVATWMQITDAVPHVLVTFV